MEVKTYSWKKGLLKGLGGALTVATGFITFAGLSDVTLVDLLNQWLPLVGSASLGFIVRMAKNWIKLQLDEVK